MDSAGHVYAKHKSNWQKTRTYWKCNKTNKFEDWKCLARVTTEGNYIIKYIRDHKHPPFGETFLK